MVGMNAVSLESSGTEMSKALCPTFFTVSGRLIYIRSFISAIAFFPIVVSFVLLRSIFSIAPQPTNAFSPISVRLSGNLTDVKAVSFAKAEAGSAVKLLLDRSTSFNALQEANAFAPIEVNLQSEIPVISSNFLHPSKALVPIEVNVFGRWILVSAYMLLHIVSGKDVIVAEEISNVFKL